MRSGREQDCRAELLPPGARRPAAVVTVGSLAVLVVLALLLRDTTAPGPLDTAAAGVAGRWFGSGRSLLDLVDDAGDAGAVPALCTAICAVLVLLGQHRFALLALAGPAVAGVLVVVLKPAVGRLLDGVPSFPSGHVTGVTSVSLVVALLWVRIHRPRAAVAFPAVGAAVLLTGTLMGVAVVVARVHAPSDVLGGQCSAAAAVLGTALVLDATTSRRARCVRRRASPAPRAARRSAAPGAASRRRR